MAFKKGQSGNPGGRPKENNEVKELARAHTVEAIERLVFWMQSNEAKASVQASLALLDRAYGKPAQAMELTGADGGPIETVSMTETEAAREVAFLLARGLKAKPKERVKH